jgi:hypothetical protein
MTLLHIALQGVAMESVIELSDYWCPNEGCKDYGKNGRVNIIIKEKFGKDNRYLLKCRIASTVLVRHEELHFFVFTQPKRKFSMF